MCSIAMLLGKWINFHEKMITVASNFSCKFAMLQSVYFAGVLGAFFLIINQIRPVVAVIIDFTNVYT